MTLNLGTAELKSGYSAFCTWRRPGVFPLGWSPSEHAGSGWAAKSYATHYLSTICGHFLSFAIKENSAKDASLSLHTPYHEILARQIWPSLSCFLACVTRAAGPFQKAGNFMLHQTSRSPPAVSAGKPSPRTQKAPNHALVLQMHCSLESDNFFSSQFVINKNLVQLFQKSKWAVSSLPLVITHLPFVANCTSGH